VVFASPERRAKSQKRSRTDPWEEGKKRVGVEQKGGCASFGGRPVSSRSLGKGNTKTLERLAHGKAKGCGRWEGNGRKERRKNARLAGFPLMPGWLSEPGSSTVYAEDSEIGFVC